jgi:DNA-binding NarL/FixJ family response regulator
LDSSDGFECVGSFKDANNLMEDLLRSEPDVVLMDIDMPDINGIEAVKIIKQELPDLPIMMQTVFDHDDKVFESILAGATGYLLKKTSPVKLLHSIAELYEGGAPMTPEIAIKVLGFFRKVHRTTTTSDIHLTEKEMLVLSGLVDGLSYKMIADANDISYHTVNFHVRNIYQKLHVHSIGEAVAKAIKERLV